MVDVIKMPRKYDRYGFNRQYRRDPSRKRNPLPYRLPFMPDYRIFPKDDPDYDVSAATASRYRTLMDELVSKYSDTIPLLGKRKRDRTGRSREHKRKARRVAEDIGAAVTSGSGYLARESFNNLKRKAAGDWGSKIAVGSAYGRSLTVGEFLAML